MTACEFRVWKKIPGEEKKVICCQMHQILYVATLLYRQTKFGSMSFIANRLAYKWKKNYKKIER